MRKVYDDRMFRQAAAEIREILYEIHTENVRKYEYGMDRVQPSMIRDYVNRKLSRFTIGVKDINTGIGNNHRYEIIFIGNEGEREVCGILGLTDDMFGGVISYVENIIDEDDCRILRKFR